ncbi:MAG TPA: 2TM domain-containing protein [Rhizobacter sp.]
MSRRHDLPPDSLEARALARVRRKIGFYTHAMVFVMVHLGFGIAFLVGARSKPFFVWGWALGLAIHGAFTFMTLQGEGMRERMLRQEIERMRRERGEQGERGDGEPKP